MSDYTTNINYTLTIDGNSIYIDFDHVNNSFDVVFRSSSLRIGDGGDDVLVMYSGADFRKINYTLDLDRTEASKMDYINALLTEIRIEELSANNGIAVSKNDVNKLTSINKFGYNPNLDTGTVPEDIWYNEGTYTGHPLNTTETIEVFSSDVNDTSAGTGARTITIFGLGTTLSEDYTTETITLDGTTPVPSVNSWYRVSRAWIETSGSSGYNEGTITIRHTTTTANVFATIAPTFNQTLVSAFTIPYNNTGYIDRIQVTLVRSSGASGSGLATLRVRDTLNSGVYRTREVMNIQTGGPYVINFEYPMEIPQGADIKITVDEVSDNNSIMSSDVSLLLIKNGI